MLKGLEDSRFTYVFHNLSPSTSQGAFNYKYLFNTMYYIILYAINLPQTFNLTRAHKPYSRMRWTNMSHPALYAKVGDKLPHSTTRTIHFVTV